MERSELETILEMIQDLQMQISGLTQVTRALIETHPNRALVDRVLERQQLRLEAVFGGSAAPDQVTDRLLSLIADMRTIAQRDPEQSQMADTYRFTPN